MCEYCGCRQIVPLAELMDEHLALLDLGDEVRRKLVHGEVDDAVAMLRHCATLLLRHVRREEDGVFAALKGEGEFVEEIEELEAEHVDLDARLAALDAETPDLKSQVESFLADLALHIDREDLGIFPVSVVSLRARGWAVVERIHEEQPSFLQC
jgi:hypothetical protein